MASDFISNNEYLCYVCLTLRKYNICFPMLCFFVSKGCTFVPAPIVAALLLFHRYIFVIQIICIFESDFNEFVYGLYYTQRFGLRTL